MKKTVIFCAVLSACTFVICAMILVNPSIKYRNASGIKVKGVAVEKVQSDAIEWSANIKTYGQTIQSAAELSANFTDIVMAEFAKNGLMNVGFSTAAINPIYVRENGSDTNRIEKYAATVSISFAAKSEGDVQKAQETVFTLLNKNVPIFSNGAAYYYTKLEDLKMKLLETAAKNARERAEKLVSGSGSKLGEVASASQGIFQITRPLSNETSDWGMYDTSSYLKEVRCVVTIEFNLKDSFAR